MKGKKIRFKILIGIALVLIVSGAAGMIITPDKQPDQVIPNRFGDVTWSHDLHARMKEIGNCTVCHHTSKQGDTSPQPCLDCHKETENGKDLLVPEMFMQVETVTYEGENGPPAMTAAHSKCLGCHQAMKKGPTVCRDCHKQTFTGPHGLVKWDHMSHSRRLDMNDKAGLDDNCVTCHHKDQDAKTDGDYRACSTCHKPAEEIGLQMATGIRDHQSYKHGQCQECHVEFNPEDKNTPCIECHRGMLVNTETTRPSLEQAIHQRCATCHNEDYDELEGDMPVVCRDCHKTDPNRIESPGMNTIVWDHKRHADYSDFKCIDCHHTDHADAPKLACNSCHGKDLFMSSPLKDALEEQCIDCHQEQGVSLTSWESMTFAKMKKGLYKYSGEDGSFLWNHRFHAIDASLSCQNCHHNIIQKDGQYVTAQRVDKRWPDQAGHIQSCRNCHGENGPVATSVAANTSAPSINGVYKQICVACHDKIGGGPQEWEDYFKIEPLEKE